MVKKSKVVVVGSFMMDLVVKAERRPNIGEMLVGEEFGMFLGGKGMNQAIAGYRNESGCPHFGLAWNLAPHGKNHGVNSGASGECRRYNCCR